MSTAFPVPILSLPKVKIPVPGVEAYLSQAKDHQILYMHFSQDAEVPEHSHESQWGVVLDGRIDLTVAGVQTTYKKGDQYFIPAGVKHSARIHAGYTDITFFASPDRYRPSHEATA
jgi:quercetin dioxygenase-like cupin family protein